MIKLETDNMCIRGDAHKIIPRRSIADKKAVLPQGNRAMPQVFFSVQVRQQH